MNDQENRETFELFPGFKTPPTAPERELKPALTVTQEPYPELDYEEDDEDYTCPNCDGRGYLDCHCGGDLCVCTNYGEMPCPECGGY